MNVFPIMLAHQSHMGSNVSGLGFRFQHVHMCRNPNQRHVVTPRQVLTDHGEGVWSSQKDLVQHQVEMIPDRFDRLCKVIPQVTQPFDQAILGANLQYKVDTSLTVNPPVVIEGSATG